MINIVKEFFSKRKDRKVRKECSIIAHMAQSNYEDLVKRGEKPLFLAHYCDDVKIWSIEEGVIK